MALSIEQISAVSYPLVLADQRKAANQWSDHSALKFLEKLGVIKRVSFGENIEMPLDYRPNPDGGVLASDQDEFALLKTEVFTSAVYDVGQVSYPVTWTKGDDAKNPSENQKIALIKGLIENAIDSHDQLLEQLIFTSSTAGGTEINGLDVLVPTSGAGSPGGIPASTETFWVNPSDTYTDATDIEAALTEMEKQIKRGSGSNMGASFLLSGADPHSLFESVLQSRQRYQSVDEANGGFKTLMFKSMPWGYSSYGSDEIYFLNPKSYQLLVSKQYFRDKGETTPVQGQNAFYFLIYSALQFVTNNKSRLGVLRQA